MGRGINWLPFDQYLAENSRRPCMVKGCSGLRDGKSGYCTPHKRKNTIWGDPLGYSVRPHEFDQEMEDIRKLLKLNPDHPGVAFGIQWFDKTFKLAAGGADIGGSGAGFWFALLHRYHEKFETKELLIRLAGLMLLYERDAGRRVIKSFKHLVVMIGRHTVCMPGQTGGAKRSPKYYRIMGQHIQKHLGVLLLNIARGTEKMLATKNKTLADQSAEFSTE